jgi:hypothetical protein
MAFFSGKDGRASFAATTYKITRWQAERHADLPDVTNGESGGEGEYVAGVVDTEWEVDMDYNTGNSPFAAGKLNPGQTGTLILYHTNGGTNWTINAIVESSREELEVRGRVRVYARGKGTSDGTTGSTPPTT